MNNPSPQTKYHHYSVRELISFYDQCKADPDYVEELKQRLEGTQR